MRLLIAFAAACLALAVIAGLGLAPLFRTPAEPQQFPAPNTLTSSSPPGSLPTKKKENLANESGDRPAPEHLDSVAGAPAPSAVIAEQAASLGDTTPTQIGPAPPPVHWAQDDRVRAIRETYRVARATLETDPYNPAALDDAIRAGRELGRWLVVSELLARKLESDHENAQLQYEYAAALMRISRWIEAIPPLMFVVDRRPEYVEAWHNLAGCNQALGQISEALRCWDHVIDLAPNDLDARRGRAEAELDLENWSAARADFQIVLAAGVVTRADRLNLSLALCRLDRPDEARDLLEQGLRTDPDWLPGINRLAGILSTLATERPAEAAKLRNLAREWCEKSLILVSSQPEIEALRARLRETK